MYKYNTEILFELEKKLTEISNRGNPQWVLANSENKRPIQSGWQDRYPTIADVMSHHRRGGVIGIIPRSIGALVVDADYDQQKQPHIVTKKDIEDIGISHHHFYRCKSRTENAAHWWFDCDIKPEFTKINDWKFGDIIHDRSYVILWDLLDTLEHIEKKLKFPNLTNPITSIPVIPGFLKKNGKNAVGSRNNTLNSECFQAGLKADVNARLQAEQKARDSGLPNTEIIATSESGYNAGIRDAIVKFAIGQGITNIDKFADDFLSKFEEKQAEQEQPLVPIQRYTYRLLGDCLDRLGLQLKYDIIDEHFEIVLKKDFESPISAEFRQHLKPGIAVRLTERLEPLLFQEITLHLRFDQQNQRTRKYKEIEFIPKNRKDCMLAYSNIVEFNPLIDWIRNGPAWDGVHRLNNFYKSTFDAKIDGDKKKLVEFAGILTFLGPIQRNMEPGSQLDWMIVMTGPQGLQKSTLIRALQPPGMDLFSDSPDLAMNPKQLYESTDGSVFVELAEMRGVYDTTGHRTPESQREKLKGYISSRTDRRRIPYDRKSVTRPRYMTLFGSTNQKHCIPFDPSGYRRFVVVELREKPKNGIEKKLQNLVDTADKTKGTLRQQLYAEAMHLYEEFGGKNCLYRFSKEWKLEPLQHEIIAREYSIGTVDAVNRLYDANPDEFEGKTRNQIAAQFGCNKAVISTAMKNLGFNTYRKTVNGITARRFHKSLHDASEWAEKQKQVQ